MRKVFRAAILLMGLFFYSCSTKVYTHQQVMQSLLTKEQVLKHMGKPDLVKGGNEMEEWDYFGRIAYHPVKSVRDTTAATLSNTDSSAMHERFVRFIFDPQGNVTGYKSNSVDLSYSQKDSFGAATLKVLGIAALITVVVGLEIYSNSDINL